MTEEKKNEFTKRIASAGKGEMLVVVYDIALEYLSDVKDAIAADNKAEFANAINGARKSIQTLIDTLDFEYEISGSLLSLYTYFNKQLSLMHISKDIAELDSIIKMLGDLRESFAEVAKQDNSPALVQTSQHVEVGMTYGRGVLNESVVNAGGHDFSV